MSRITLSESQRKMRDRGSTWISEDLHRGSLGWQQDVGVFFPERWTQFGEIFDKTRNEFFGLVQKADGFQTWNSKSDEETNDVVLEGVELRYNPLATHLRKRFLGITSEPSRSGSIKYPAICSIWGRVRSCFVEESSFGLGYEKKCLYSPTSIGQTVSTSTKRLMRWEQLTWGKEG